MKITKQTLVDWQVTDSEGDHVAWIQKTSEGYKVVCGEYVSWHTSFKNAKEFAEDLV